MTPEHDRLDPFPRYRMLRAHHPIVQDPRTGVWSVYSYDGVQRVLSDYAFFMSGHDDPDPADVGPGASIIGMNPPAHRKLRDLVSRAFTPKAVEGLEGRIRDILADRMREPLARGRLDVVAELTDPLPVIVIAEMLGIPTRDRKQFKHWSDLIVSGTDNPVDGMNGTRAMNAYFADVVSERRNHLGDDLISSLIEAEVDGERLTDAEIISFCDLLLVAGNETTTNLITNAIWIFSDMPEVWHRLTEDRSRIPAAIEEVLRFRSPVQAMFRRVRVPMEWNGHAMHPGETVVAWIGSANRDPAKFTDPDVFDMDRHPNQHLAFGYGVHYCLGAPLARLEARLTLTALADQGIAGFRPIAPRASWEPVGGFIVHGIKHLPVELR